MFKNLVYVALIAFCGVLVQGGAPSTCTGGFSRTGAKDGEAIVKVTAGIKDGFYTFQNVKSGSYLYFNPNGNIITPAKKNTPQNTVNKWTTWVVRTHPKTKFVSIRMPNKVNHEKCISTRWITNGHKGGCDDAAVLWQCELDNKKKRDLNSTLYNQDEEEDQIDQEFTSEIDEEEMEFPGNGYNLTKRYEPIRNDKQLWVFQKVGRHSNVFKIFSLAHMFDMVPRCISNKLGWKGTLFVNCKANTGDSSIYWKMTRRSHR